MQMEVNSLKNEDLDDFSLKLGKKRREKSVEMCRRKSVEKTHKMKYYRKSSEKNFF